MSINPEYVPQTLDPLAKGLENVARIFIAGDFDISAKATASDELLSLVNSSEMSESLRQLFFEVIEDKPRVEPER